MNLLLSHLIIMLSRQDNRIQADRLAGFIIFHSHLGLAVGTKILQSTVLADLSQLKSQFVSQGDRIRHIFLRLVAGITEHHALITGADGLNLLIAHLVLFCFQSLVHTHGDIRRLLVNSSDNTAGIAVKTILCPVVSDIADGFAHNLLNIHIGFGGNLSHNHDQTCSHRCLACHTAHGILLQQCVQNRV